MSGVQRISNDELEKRFDDGEDVLQFFDVEKAVVEENPPLDKRVTLTMPQWMVSALDEEASHLAISRNAVVNTWIAEKIRQEHRELIDA